MAFRLAIFRLQRRTVREMFSRLGARFLQRRERPLDHHGAAFLSGTGSHVDDVIGDGHQFRLVLDDMRLQDLLYEHNGRQDVQEIGEGRKDQLDEAQLAG